MEIRRLDFGDADGIFSLVKEMMGERPDALVPGRIKDRKSFSEIFKAKLVGIMAGEMVDLVAEESGRIIGECEIVKEGAAGGIVGILVARGERRKGIGSMLLMASLEEAIKMGVDEAYAEVMDSNAGAAAFFYRKGFKVLERKGAAGDGQVRMHRRIVA